MTTDRPNIFISAAEHSADLHAASLMDALLKRCPGARFVGLAGPRMRRVGCETIKDLTSHSAMLAGAFLKVPEGFHMLSQVDRELASRPLDLAIVVDAPTYHLPISRRCKARGIPVLYYIAPQTWAWAEFRVNKIRRRIERLAVIFPFEEDYFRGHGIDAVYVGHPLWDALARYRRDEAFIAEQRRDHHLVVSILPGSRKHVIEEVLPGQLEVADALRRRFPRVGLMVSAADERAETVVREILRARGKDIPVHRGRHLDMINASDMVLVASGTAAVETAYFHRPMIVMYNASRIGYHLLGRWLIHTKYFCMVNILAGREVVPEFMPFYRSTEPIIAKAVGLLSSPQERERMADVLAEVIDPHVKTGASGNAADQALDLLHRNHRTRPTPPGSSHVIW